MVYPKKSRPTFQHANEDKSNAIQRKHGICLSNLATREINLFSFSAGLPQALLFSNRKIEGMVGHVVYDPNIDSFH